MVRVLVMMLGLVIGAAGLPPTPAMAQDPLAAAFDARPLDRTERRLLQTALAATGDYRGALDGLWGSASQTAIEAYAARAFADAPRDLHAATLVLELADRVLRDGWDLIAPPEFGLSFALPLGALAPPVAEDGAQRWQSGAGGLTVIAVAGDAAEAATWHAAALADTLPDATRTLVRTPDRLVSAGTLGDGWRYHLSSTRIGNGWSTLSVEAAPGADGSDIARLTLIAASLRVGPPVTWDLPASGRLAALIDATAAADAGADLLAQPAATFAGRGGAPADLPQALPPIALPPGAGMPGAGAPEGAGTGFYLGARILVTAEHVIAGCAQVTLRDGTPLELLAADADLDVAVLATPSPTPTWLALAAEAPLRLGQPVHALGFPYYALAGTQLNLTSGNVSALAGIDDDARFFSFSAPVQPGNSGGPLIDRSGAVTGLVVARLSETFISDATGTLPQNVNYALGTGELAAFLARSGVGPAGGGLGRFDMVEGAPAAIADAIVPILCR